MSDTEDDPNNSDGLEVDIVKNVDEDEDDEDEEDYDEADAEVELGSKQDSESDEPMLNNRQRE